MDERHGVLRGKLPDGIISIIRDYDSHPIADLIRDIKFEMFPGHVYAASSMQLRRCSLWPPLAREMRRREKHNRMIVSQNNGIWMPLLTYNAKIWTLSFPRWQFETLEDMDYLPEWVKEEYRLKLR